MGNVTYHVNADQGDNLDQVSVTDEPDSKVSS